MAGNPLGAGTENISVNLLSDAVRDIEALARKSGMKKTVYVRQVLLDAIAIKTVYSLPERGSLASTEPPLQISSRRVAGVAKASMAGAARAARLTPSSSRKPTAASTSGNKP